MITGTDLAERFFSSNGTTYDQIANLSTLGLDIWWKKLILNKVPKGSRQILDQACGTGILTFKIARKFPHCRVIGVDLQDEYISIARKKAKDLQLTNIEFISGRAEDVILDGGFDCITSSYLAKYADLDRLIENARGMLREGVLIIHELLVLLTRFWLALEAELKFPTNLWRSRNIASGRQLSRTAGCPQGNKLGK